MIPAAPGETEHMVAVAQEIARSGGLATQELPGAAGHLNRPRVAQDCLVRSEEGGAI